MCLARSVVQISRATRSPRLRPQGTIHFKEETVSLCHPERSEGSLFGERSFAALRMTILHRLRLTRKTSYLKCIARKGHQYTTKCTLRVPGDHLITYSTPLGSPTWLTMP